MDKAQNRSFEESWSLAAPLLNEKITRYTLPNGLSVLLKPDRGVGVASVQVWVKTGSIHEGEWLGTGISHFVEHMLFKGTAKREGRDISRIVQAAGGYINAYTTFDRTVYYIDIPSENVETAFDVLGDSVFQSVFPEGEVDKEREVILREIDMGEDDPDHKLSRLLFENSFRSHHYRYPIIGYRDLFSKVTRDDLLQYYKSRYIPNNVVLVASGDFDVAKVRGVIETHFGGFERRCLPSLLLPEEPKQLAARECRLHEDVQVARVGLGFQTPGLSHPDTPALDALAIVLGSGNSSLLNLKLREKLRLVHMVDATNWTPGSVGVFYVALLCDPENRDAAIEEVKRMVADLSTEDLKQDVVEKSVRQILASEVNARKTVSGQASRLGLSEVVIGEVGYAKNYLKRVAEVTPEEIIRVARRWLRPEVLTSVSLEPETSGTVGGEVNATEAKGMEFEERQLTNGSTLLLRKNDKLPNVHIRVVLQAGSLFETPEKQGLTALTANLLTKDTATRTASEVADAIESVGGAFYEFSGNNSMGLAIDLMPSDVDLALDLLSQSLLHPAFAEDTFNLEKDAQLAGIKEGRDDIVSLGRDRLRARFFGEHPFRLGAAGDLETVESIALGEVESFFRKIRVGGNVTVAVSGNFDYESFSRQLETILEQIPAGEINVPANNASSPSVVGSSSEVMDRQQVVVYHGFPCPGLKSDDFYISEVMDELFSGMSSNLFERVREELSLAYFVRSNRIIGLDTGMFYLYAGASPDRYGEVIVELDREIKRVLAGDIASDELKRCKTRLKAGRRMSMQTNSSCASQVAMNVAYGLPVDDWRRYDDRIESVEAKDLQCFAEKYFDISKRVEFLIGAL